MTSECGSPGIGDYRQGKENKKIEMAAEAKKQEEANALQAQKDDLLAKKPDSLKAIAQSIESGDYQEAQREIDKFQILNDPEIIKISNKVNLAMLNSEKASAFRKMQELIKLGDFQGAIDIEQRFKPLNDEGFSKLATIAVENKKLKDAAENAKRQQQEREAEVERQAENYFRSHRSSINHECRRHIERGSNYDIHWEDESSIGEKYGVRGDTGNITIAGSKAKIQMPSGAFHRITYVCAFDPRTETVIRSSYDYAP